jgi:hypothetical protein
MCRMDLLEAIDRKDIDDWKMSVSERKATPLGLEPRIKEPKSLVLPITPRGNADPKVAGVRKV